MRIPASMALAATLSGCVVYAEAGADATVSWTFQGFDCERGDVDTVMVEWFRGGSLEARDFVPCAPGAARYHGFLPGRLLLHVEGLDLGFVKYHFDGPVDLYAGDNAFHVDLAYVQ